MNKPNEETAAEMVEKAQTEAAPEPEPTSFPPALLADIHQIQAEQQRLQNEMVRTLRGFFHAKDLDMDRDDLTVDLQAGTWRLGRPRE